LIRFRKKRGNKKAFALVSLIVFGGLAGNQMLASMTDNRPIEKFTLDRISGKDQLIQQHKQEIKVSNELIQQIEAERYRLFEEKVSRGEMDRLKELNKQKVITAIANNLGGVFAGKARYIHGICKGYEVNPMLLAAIIKQETGNGTSQAVRNLNNPGGIMLQGSKLKKFATLENGIEAMARLLKDFYIDEGRCDIVSIGAKYCPVGAKNDPKGLNRHWVPNVTTNYNKILKEVEK
jgi:hypothetical protein